MPPIVYRVTKHAIPGWVPFHEKEPRGIAYEDDTHFVHVFGRDRDLWTVSIGLTVTEAKRGTLRDWVERTFGAVEIEETVCEVGHTIQGVWRPGLYFDDEILQALSASKAELRLAEQALLILIQRLDELLHFVEPTPSTLETHSHKARELLILACTEVENTWKSYMRIAGVSPPSKGGFTTKDFVRLLEPLRLDEYEVSLPRYEAIPAMRPFSGWAAAQPSQSLRWYDAYNKTKHDRSSHFVDATLRNCLKAVSANLALFAVRFGPYRLYNGGGTLSAFFNELFSLELKECTPSSFYAPKLTISSDHRADLICFDSRDFLVPRVVDQLRL